MEIAIIGAGAMGCIFGALLSASARVILMDPWEAHVRAIREAGLTLEDGKGKTVTIRLPVVMHPREVPRPVDLAIVFTKSYRTRQAVEDAAAVLKKTGLALTLQNGVGNVEILEERLGSARALAGVTSHGGTLLGPGRVRHAGKGPTVIGRSPTHAREVERIVRVFQEAGIDCRVEENVQRLIWGKLVVNVGINALAAVLRVPNGVLGSEKACETLMAQAVSEAVAVARGLGIALPYEAPLAHVKRVCENTAKNRASMLQDILRGAPTEIGAINGAVVQKGEALGIPTPCNRFLTQIVRALEATARERIE